MLLLNLLNAEVLKVNSIQNTATARTRNALREYISPFLLPPYLSAVKAVKVESPYDN